MPSSNNTDEPLRFPPVSADFLRFLMGDKAHVEWINLESGLFWVLSHPDIVPPAVPSDHTVLRDFLYTESVVDIPVNVKVPETLGKPASSEPPRCYHLLHSVKRTVVRQDNPNLGRHYYTCSRQGIGRCNFFRWQSDNSSYTEICDGRLVSLDKNQRRTFDDSTDADKAVTGINSELQIESWEGTKQGSDRWHRLRSWRITASNFGSVTGSDKFRKSHDLLRNLLWPVRCESFATLYGSTNEKVSLDHLMDWLLVQGYGKIALMIDEPGSWIPSHMPYTAGSPDGILYECVDAFDDGNALLCRRILIEIKTPYKLRTRKCGGDFYPMETMLHGVHIKIPGSYWDQVQGNCYLMGMACILFVVMSPTGYQILTMPYDKEYCQSFLIPKISNFWYTLLRPAFECMDSESCDFGVLPNFVHKSKK